MPFESMRQFAGEAPINRFSSITWGQLRKVDLMVIAYINTVAFLQ